MSILRGFGLQRAMRAPETDDGFDTDEPDLELDDELDDQDDEEPDDLDTDEDPDEEPPPERRPRGESRQARLASENRELRERLERLERDRQAPPAPPAPRGETQEEFNRRVAEMEPGERALYLSQLGIQATQQQLQEMKFSLEDRADKDSFQAFCDRQPRAGKYAKEVETRLADYRKQGMNIPRMDVLKHILGEAALSNVGKSRGRQAAGAEQRREAQRARPAGGRSDAPRESREEQNSRAARLKRLEGLKI